MAGKKIDNQTRKQVTDALRRGYTYDEIKKQFHVSSRTIKHISDDIGLREPKKSKEHTLPELLSEWDIVRERLLVLGGYYHGKRKL